MRQRDLHELPIPHQRMPWRTRIKRAIAPNDVFWFENVVGVEVRQSSNGDDFPVNWNAVSYVIAQEDTFAGIQGYVRFVDRDGNFVGSTTVRNYRALTNGHPPRESEREGFGSYHWITVLPPSPAHPNGDFIIADMGAGGPRGFTYADDPPWTQRHNSGNVVVVR